ncbi:MAG TPA: uracil phosphoribosyltransferase [Bacteroidia bacterium]|nr:uracil phosphoribosyltransferase [Bacteroidia bacterium]
MNMTDVFNGLGHLFQRLFHLMDKLRAIPATIFIVLGFIAFGIWLTQMKRYNEEAEKNGTLK